MKNRERLAGAGRDDASADAVTLSVDVEIEIAEHVRKGLAKVLDYERIAFSRGTLVAPVAQDAKCVLPPHVQHRIRLGGGTALSQVIDGVRTIKSVGGE